jgi:hypothetical protein
MRVIVHIGTEKTGTTTIQELMVRNREALGERGFHVVRCAGRANHRAIPAYCMRTNRRDDHLRNHLIDSEEKRERFRAQLRQDFHDEITNLDERIHTVLISSEHFHSLLVHRDEVATLRELLEPHFTDIHILVYLREQVDTALSRYSTAIKSGRTVELDDFLQKCTPENAFYNYDRLLQNWEQVFGREHIEAAIFSREELAGHDLAIDFLGRMEPGLSAELDIEIDAANESLSELGQTIGRAINMAFPVFEPGIGVNPLRARLMKVNYRHFRGRSEPLDRERRDGLSGQFEASNEAVRQRYFPDRETLFATTVSPSRPDTDEPDLALALNEMFQLVLADRNVIPQRYVDIFRNAAIRLEDSDLDKAYELMNLAHSMRPDGPLIAAKLEEYRERLGARAPEDTGQTA